MLDKDSVVHDEATQSTVSGLAARIFKELGEGRLGADAVAAIEAWLAAEGGALPPEVAIARARRISRQFRPRNTASPVRRPTAALVYDTQRQALPAGVRMATQRARSVLFATGEVEVLLQVTSDASRQRLKLMGQVLAEGAPVEAALVQLDGPAGPVDVKTDLDGEFQIADLPSGEYSMEIVTSEQVISCWPLTFEEWR